MVLGIIGTAGRDNNSKLTADLFLMVYSILRGRIVKKKITKLVSGGAAGIDHICVKLALELEQVEEVTLHLPADWVPGFNNFEITTDSPFDPAKIANFYHRKFSAIMGYDTLKELGSLLMEDKTKFFVTPGFKERNTKVAQQADILVACTFGKKNLLKDGGTADTMRKYLAFRAENHLPDYSYHLDLNDLRLYFPAKTN